MSEISLEAWGLAASVPDSDTLPILPRPPSPGCLNLLSGLLQGVFGTLAGLGGLSWNGSWGWGAGRGVSALLPQRRLDYSQR